MPIANDNRQQVLQTFGKSRPFFVPNVGQADSRLHYYVKGADYEAYFMPGEVLLTFQEKPAGDFSPTAALGSIFPQSAEKWNKQVRGVRLSLAFLDSNPAAKPTGRKLATRTVNYLKGNDSSKWHTNIPTYEHVVYPKLWPGIDLVFHSDNGRIKYEFVVQPGAKMADIRFAYRGAKSLSLDEQGNLLIHTEIGELREARPFSYQQIGGRKANVSSSFLLEQQLDGAPVIRFRIGADYDPHYPLVIDPELEYSTYLGGGNFEIGFAIAVDVAGNAYVTGSTNTPETAAVPFPITPGAFQTTFGGTSDAFVAKLNPAGNTFLYSTYLGGGGIDQGSAIAVDSLGNAYITGNTNSSQTNPVPFPITPGAFQTTFGGALDAFVTKLNPAGNALVYSTYLGGDSIDFGSGITVDAAGNAYIVGTTATSQLDFTPFPITPGAFQTSFGGNTDVFVTQLNAAGNALIYSTYLGGGSFDSGAAIAVDSLGNAYVTGSTSTPETDPVPFPITPGSFQTLYGGGSSDAFIAKLNATGSTLVYSTYLGGGQNDAGAAIAVDTAGNAYVAGSTATLQTDPVPFPITPGAFQTVYGGGLLDAFVTKLNPTGSALVFSTYLGGSQDDQAFGIALDSLPNVYVAGITNTPQTAPVPFPITLNAFQRNYGGGSHDAFVTSLNTAGNALRYSTYLGGGQDDQAFGISVDGSGNAYVHYSRGSADFIWRESGRIYRQNHRASSADPYQRPRSLHPRPQNIRLGLHCALGPKRSPDSRRVPPAGGSRNPGRSAYRYPMYSAACSTIIRTRPATVLFRRCLLDYQHPPRHQSRLRKRSAHGHRPLSASLHAVDPRICQRRVAVRIFSSCPARQRNRALFARASECLQHPLPHRRQRVYAERPCTVGRLDHHGHRHLRADPGGNGCEAGSARQTLCTSSELVPGSRPAPIFPLPAHCIPAAMPEPVPAMSNDRQAGRRAFFAKRQLALRTFHSRFKLGCLLFAVRIVPF
ncbi:SBBP repeat-containing protein [Brevibacillus sp. HD3.3A]|uniref:DUF7948 domain-containing protein n=1 Tax=Brevibacillus sp. HD3.3A TaxID=2738979 RepID=UPI00156AAA44|nr:SBBP repeat-containing protein [Brevibacillus sp. HD3.3A]UED67393.1 SBBP repeat-containing protein [Brevibacillus sp. HD3.3A]